MATTLSIASIPGDGIGPEVVAAALPVVHAAAARHDGQLQVTEYDWGSERYRATGAMMPADGLDTLARHDAIFFGAVGAPDISDVETLWGLLLPMRRAFDQYVNLRPVHTVPGVPSPLAHPDGIDLVIVRENTEGEYSDEGTVSDDESTQVARFTRHGTGARGALRRAAGRHAERPAGVVHEVQRDPPHDAVLG